MFNAGSGSKGKIVREAILSILINGAAPLVIYSLLSSHMAEVPALTIAALVPVLDNLFQFARHRRLDFFGIFMLAALLLSIGVTLLGGDARLILVRESLITGLLGLVMLGSMLLPRPMLFHFAAHFMCGHDRVRLAEFNARWKYSYFRFVMYLMTLVWGVSLLGEAIIRTIMAFNMSTTEFLAASPFVQYGILGVTIFWNVRYAGHSRRRMMAIMQQSQANGAQNLQTVSAES
ncbi:MAG TPA: VC0807 family protein [Chloroflexia bacterium]|nr:VC0807 family protein [Chloroflexia bacterium]